MRMSQTFTVESVEPAAMNVELGWKATEFTKLVYSLNVWTHSREFLSHSLIVLSSEDETISRASSENLARMIFIILF